MFKKNFNSVNYFAMGNNSRKKLIITNHNMFNNLNNIIGNPKW